MDQIYIKARAKVNLNLEIVGKREDQYHNIKSVFQKINLYDELLIKKIKTDHIEIITNKKELDAKENIINKAYSFLKQKYKNITGVQVILNKKIPMQAGLAGGSTDCASFIVGMDQLFNLKLSKKEMEQIGKSLGADVIPCYYNRALMVEGIGDRVTPIATCFNYYFVIIKPEIFCNTKEMYQRIDQRKKMKEQGHSSKIVKGLEEKKLAIIANNLYNIFEEVIEDKELIQGIKKELINQGAIRKFNDRVWFLCLWYIC